MTDNEEILKRLDEIVFHDVPVMSISFNTEYSTDFSIDFALYQESKKDYDYWTIKFKKINKLTSNKLQLNSESNLEI